MGRELPRSVLKQGKYALAAFLVAGLAVFFDEGLSKNAFLHFIFWTVVVTFISFFYRLWWDHFPGTRATVRAIEKYYPKWWGQLLLGAAIFFLIVVAIRAFLGYDSLP